MHVHIVEEWLDLFTFELKIINEMIKGFKITFMLWILPLWLQLGQNYNFLKVLTILKPTTNLSDLKLKFETLFNDVFIFQWNVEYISHLGDKGS